MLVISLILFAAAAVFGIINLIPILKNKQTSEPAVYTHGFLAAAALLLLIIFSIDFAGGLPVISMILFIIVALVGFILFARDLFKKPGPKSVALIHGAVAFISFILLLIFVFNS